MRARRGVIVLAVAILSACLAIGSSCAWFTLEKLTVRLMQNFPGDSTSFECWNIEGLGEDSDLYDVVYTQWRGKWATFLAELGIDPAEVTSVAQSGTVTMIEGEFDSQKMSDMLEQSGYEEERSYRDADRWKNADGNWLAFVEGAVMIGPEDDLKECIDATRAKEGFLGDNLYVSDVAERLPDGLVSSISTTSNFESVQAWGQSYEQEDENTLRVKVVYRFDRQGGAENGKDAIGEDWGSKAKYYDTSSASQDDEFVELTAKIAMDDFTEVVMIEPIQQAG